MSMRQLETSVPELKCHVASMFVRASQRGLCPQSSVTKLLTCSLRWLPSSFISPLTPCFPCLFFTRSRISFTSFRWLQAFCRLASLFPSPMGPWAETA